MYTIAPVHGPTKVKQVHRTMLKAMVGVESLGCASSHNSSVEELEYSFEYCLLVLRLPPSVHPSVMPSTR